MTEEAAQMASSFFLASRQYVTAHASLQQEQAQKMNEQSRNVHENKWPLWKTCDESANVYEKKAVSPTTRECW
jgi:hypothetical protein